jgi:hypothetical protein
MHGDQPGIRVLNAEAFLTLTYLHPTTNPTFEPRRRLAMRTMIFPVAVRRHSLQFTHCAPLYLVYTYGSLDDGWLAGWYAAAEGCIRGEGNLQADD